MTLGRPDTMQFQAQLHQVFSFCTTLSQINFRNNSTKVYINHWTELFLQPRVELEDGTRSILVEKHSVRVIQFEVGDRLCSL